jgi:hypothetical protein
MRNLISLMTLALLFAALPAAAQAYDWSNVGSVGILAAGIGGVFDGATFKHAPLRTGSLTARYPVTNTYGSSTSKTPPWTTLYAAVSDNSSAGSVTAKLVEVDKCSNTETTLCTLTSSDNADPQCATCTFSSSAFDFANNHYYVQVTIARTSTSASPELHSLGIN